MTRIYRANSRFVRFIVRCVPSWVAGVYSARVQDDCRTFVTIRWFDLGALKYRR